MKKRIIVTDGMDNDGRVAGLIAWLIFDKKADFIYLSRGKKVRGRGYLY